MRNYLFALVGLFIISSCTISSCTPVSNDASAASSGLTDDTVSLSTQTMVYANQEFESVINVGQMMEYLTMNANTMTVVPTSNSVNCYIIVFQNDTINRYYVETYDTDFVSVSLIRPLNWNLTSSIFPSN